MATLKYFDAVSGTWKYVNQPPSVGGGGGGSSAWGGITGTLGDQTDLNTALAAKASTTALTAHTSNTSNPHAVTKTQVGLPNVDNTSDANKPVSTAQATAIAAKANTSHTHAISDLTAGGSPSATTYLRGDNTWAAIPGGGGGTASPRGAYVFAAPDTPAAYSGRSDATVPATGAQTVLAAAINAGPVYLLPGTYNLSGAINITIENPDVEGSGWSTIIRLSNGHNGYAFTATPPGNGVRGSFRNFKVDGNCGNQTAGGGFHAIGFVQSVFHFVHVTNCYNVGLWLDSFTGNGAGAFGHHNKVLSCLFDATLTSPGTGIGLVIQGSDENLITSEFQYLGGTGTPTYAVRDLSGLNNHRNSVFVGGRNNMGGIEFRDGKDSSAIGCTFDGTSGDNIFAASVKGLHVQDNTFVSVADQATANNTYAGIHLEYAVNQSIITGNTFLTSATNTRTKSYIKEDNAGGTGGNIIKQNIGRVQGTGGLGSAAYDLNGTGSATADNLSV